MTIDERTWREARDALQHHDATTPRLGDVLRRARGLRTRRIGIVVAALVFIATGIFVPLGVLSGLGSGARQPAVPSEPADWARHVEPRDDVSIDTPGTWWFDEDPIPDLLDPRLLFAVGTGAESSLLDCKETELGRAVPSQAVIVEVMEAGWLQESPVDLTWFPPRPERITLDEMEIVERDDVCLSPYRLMNFSDRGRQLSLFAYLGEAIQEGGTPEIEEVLNSLVVGPAAHQPLRNGRMVVASGDAFGKVWSLVTWEIGDQICFELTGTGGGCSPRPDEASGHYSVPTPGATMSSSDTSSSGPRGPRCTPCASVSGTGAPSR